MPNNAENAAIRRARERLALHRAARGVADLGPFDEHAFQAAIGANFAVPQGQWNENEQVFVDLAAQVQEIRVPDLARDAVDRPRAGPRMRPYPQKRATIVKDVDGNSEMYRVFAHNQPPPRDHREGMILSLPPKPFPHDHCVGIEIEIEGFHPSGDQKIDNLLMEGFQRIPDGSLRNNGVEFITQFGMTAGDVLSYIEVLDHGFEMQRKSVHRNTFSFRCGLHVHVDVSKHTMEQLYRVFLLYTVLERTLFKISGSRNANKFCVSVLDSVTAVGNALHYGRVKDWKQFSETVFHGTKYMAMNIKPVRSRGSIEFRHHEGSSNPEKIKNWLLVLTDLVAGSKQLYTAQLEREILDLNTNSQYEEFLRRTMPNSCHLLYVRGYEKDMYAGINFIKEAFAGGPEALPHQGEPE